MPFATVTAVTAATPRKLAAVTLAGARRALLGGFVLASALTASVTGCKSRQVVEVAAGKDNSCLRTQDGRVYCWGDDAYTQSKNPSFASNPGQRTTPKRVPGIEGARTLALAASHGCAGVEGGGLRCFLDVDLEPISVAGIQAKSLAASSTGVCAVSSGGELKCFRNANPREIPTSPVEVPKLSTAEAVATGERHVCVLDKDGTVGCFGDQAYGQLGPQPPSAPDAPPNPNLFAKLADIKDATAISAGRAHTCVLLRSGRVSCWGANEIGQLGRALGPMVDVVLPKPAEVEGIEGATALSAGAFHSCAVVQGAVKCWGSNFYGESGRTPTKVAQTQPQLIEQVNDAVHVACGEQHTCAVLKGGAVKCWGRNNRGQLGSGNTTDSWRPVPVKLP